MTAFDLIRELDYMAIEIQMILSAIVIIYLGAHASLRRPPSASPRTVNNKDGKSIKDEEKKEQFSPGFEARDALYFPLVAGGVLISLYYILQWLKDPTILNTLLRWYMSITSVASNGALLGNAMQVLVGFVFPDQWLDSKGKIWIVDPRRRRVQMQGGGDADVMPSPFPGRAAKLTLSHRTNKAMFTLRHLLVEDWHMDFNIFGICKESFDYKLTTLIGFIMGVILQGAYLYTGYEFLSNIIGLAVCYMAFTLISVTSFSIGSFVLGGLFVYDIIMVFYTPFMISVATQIEAPIKLSYHTAKRSSMLGLGDIVLPGIFICMALRFDLWLHYHGKEKRMLTRLEKLSQIEIPANGMMPSWVKEVITHEVVHLDVKAPFVECRGQWGNYFWTSTWRSLFSGGRGSSSKAVAESTFPKTYFYATIGGYLLGMVVTIGVLLVVKHGQPALLYLVPCTVGSLFLTGVFRRELREVLMYTEDGSLDTKSVVVDTDGEGNPISPAPEPAKDGSKDDKAKNDDATKEEDQRKDYEAVLFSITVPREEEDPRKQA